jgi:glucose-6-phosphate isomerase
LSIVGRRMKFLQSIDPIAVATILADLDPSSTLVISIAVTGNEETTLATSLVKQWLLQRLCKNSDSVRTIDSVLSKHMIVVTGNDKLAGTIHKPESLYLLPQHARCEPLTTFTAATLLPLAIVFGWTICQEYIAGAHDMDTHFCDVNPRHNLPILLAMADVWNDNILHQSTHRAVVPFTDAFRSFPAFVGTLEAQICSGRPSLEFLPSATFSQPSCCAPLILDGGLCGSFDRAFFQSNPNVNSELIMTMDCQVGFHTSRSPFHRDDVHLAQDTMFCSFFAHADELAFGPTVSDSLETDMNMPLQHGGSLPRLSPESSAGNRPSILLLCGKLDAFTCGQLVAMSEHRATVKALLLGIDPFIVQDVGSSIRSDRTEKLRDELSKRYMATTDTANGSNAIKDNDEIDSMCLSTETLLGHYASLMRGDRVYTVEDKNV